MKKYLLPIVVILTSCANDFNRLADLKKKFPHAVVIPGRQFNNKGGSIDEFYVKDSITGHMFGVEYWPFSESSICTIRTID